jgi:branched-chain amino acid transport system permease protein
LRAAAEDFETVRLMGMNSNRLISVSFVLSGVLAGIAGVLWVFQRGSVDPLMSITPLLWSFVAVVIGGLGSLSGAVAGGFLLGFLEVTLRAVLPDAALPYREAIELFLLISVFFVRPRGLIPLHEYVR